MHIKPLRKKVIKDQSSETKRPILTSETKNKEKKGRKAVKRVVKRRKRFLSDLIGILTETRSRIRKRGEKNPRPNPRLVFALFSAEFARGSGILQKSRSGFELHLSLFFFFF